MLNALALISLVAISPQQPRLVEFQNGDRIVLLGNEFFERDLDHAYIETQLTTRFPDKNLSFRNLGYSGDTVWADARSLCSGWATFGPPDQGFNRLGELIEQIKPTLVLVAYGMNESFDGPSGLDHFQQGLNRMLDMLNRGRPRIALISPIPHEDLGPPLPDPAEHNHNIRLYADAMKQIAEQRHVAFIDLYAALGDSSDAKQPHLTSDGIHLRPYGYWRVARVLEQAMDYVPRQWRVEIDAASHTVSSEGTKVQLSRSDKDEVDFTATDQTLPLPPSPADASNTGSERLLKISGLAQGEYVLRSGDQTLETASAEQWAKGVEISGGPAQQREEQLRKLVIAKDFDFFNYWRPQNDTYIFGYRKHEQGKNAVEIPRFVPLVQTKEAEVAKLRVPAPVEYVLKRATSSR